MATMQRSAPSRPAPSPSTLDAALAAFALMVSVGPQFAHAGEGVPGPALRGLGVALAIVAATALLWRRRNPLLALAFVESLVVVMLIAVRADLRFGAVPLVICVYTAAARGPRARTLRAAAIVAGVNAAIVAGEYVTGHWQGIGDVVFNTVLIGGAWAVGDNIGTRRAYLAGLVERAERLERERETATQRAALEERTRIARELHDVVAHHVSAIAVQAGAAQEIAAADAGRAAEVLRTIQATSRQALAEMRAIVGVLHEDSAGALAPAPRLADLDALAAQSRAAGLDVHITVDGAPPHALPEALDLSAYRIVQEALTNTLKHAGAARVEVTVRYGQDSVELVVEDDGRAGGAAAALPGAGRGLVGMRERVALFHGRLELGRAPGGGFRVHAVLPLQASPAP